MRDLFVPYEIALKLKEKGFDEPCLGYFDPLYKKLVIWENGSTNSTSNWVYAPLWQQVIDWLRDKHQIEIVLSGITVYDIRKYHICLYYIVDGIMTDHSMLLFDEETREYAGYQTFTYPEARQAAIEHALTLI